MKIKRGFKLLSVAGEYMVVPLGMQTVNFQAMITLNETGAFLWKALQDDCTEDELIIKLQDCYDVDREKAIGDVKKFLDILNREGLLS